MTDLSKLATEEGLEVAPGVRVRLRSLADYRQNEENPVAHSPRNAQAVLDSIHRVGAGRSGFASKGKILAGNLTYEMMAEAGIEGVVEVTTDGKRWVMVNREDLTPEQEKQAAYRDQFGSMLSSWNVEQIAVDLETDMDIEGLWTGDELAELVAEWVAEEGAGEAPEPQMDRASELQEIWRVELGQLWQLGEHRLICGDCTDSAVVDAVMGGEKANLVITDPPYGVSYAGLGQHTKGQVIANDDLAPEELRPFLLNAFSCWDNFMQDGCVIYVCHADGPHGTRPAFELAFADAGWTLSATIIWVKQTASMGWQDYRAQHEPLLYGWKSGNHYFCGDRSQTTVWNVSRDAQAQYLHPTQKPVALYERAIKNSTKIGWIVFDGFSGGGPATIACERLGRKGRAIEIEPKYCAVTIQRWADLTGLEPQLLP